MLITVLTNVNGYIMFPYCKVFSKGLLQSQCNAMHCDTEISCSIIVCSSTVQQIHHPLSNHYLYNLHLINVGLILCKCHPFPTCML